MSGGSYDYLYCKEVSELAWSEAPIDSLVEMANDLEKEFPGTKAAVLTREVVTQLQEALTGLGQKVEALSRVWYAMEWWKSCDSSFEHPMSEVAKLEGLDPTKSSHYGIYLFNENGFTRAGYVVPTESKPTGD